MLAVLAALTVAIWPLATGLAVTVEDGFYYLQIASNIARGAGSTFDGLHPTNGYHPLWMACLAILSSFAPDPDRLLALAGLLQAALAIIAAGFFYRGARFLLRPAPAALAVLAWVALSHRLWLSGLELDLLSLALAMTFYVYMRWFRTGPPASSLPFLFLGLGCAAAFLARLDSALLTAVLALAIAISSHRSASRPPASRWALFLAPPLLAAAAYAAINVKAFGHPAPVSAMVKRSWSETLLHRDATFQEHGWAIHKGRALAVPLVFGWSDWRRRPLALGLAAAAAWSLLWLACRRRSGRRQWFDVQLRPLGPWLAYGVLSFVVYTLVYFRGLSLAPWYYAVQPWLGAMVVAALVDHVASNFRIRTAVFAGAFALVLAAIVHGLFARHGDARALLEHPSRQAARWIQNNLLPEARVASWNPGMMAYFSGRPIVNLDGLVNSRKYFENDRHDLCGYLRRTGVTHIVDIFVPDEATIVPVTPVPEPVPCPQSLELRWSEDRGLPAWSLRAYRLRFDEPSNSASGSLGEDRGAGGGQMDAIVEEDLPQDSVVERGELSFKIE